MMSLHQTVRGLSQWSIDLRDVPILLRLLDDHALPVDIGVIGHAGEVAIRAAGVCCRQEGMCLCVEGPEVSVAVDLGRLRYSRAVRRTRGFPDRLTLELAGRDGEYRFSVSTASDTGGVWRRVMEALAIVPGEPMWSPGFPTTALLKHEGQPA